MSILRRYFIIRWIKMKNKIPTPQSANPRNRGKSILLTQLTFMLMYLFLYSYEAKFIPGLLKINKWKPVRYFNFTFHYIDDVLWLNSSRFGNFVYRSYLIGLAIKDTVRSASYLDLHLQIDSDGRLRNLTTKEMTSFFLYMQQHSSSTCIRSAYLAGFVTRLTRRVPLLVEQELLTLH